MEYQILDQKSKNKFAKLISLITHPPLIAIPTFLLINIFLLGFSDSISYKHGLPDICSYFANLNFINSNKKDEY